MQSNTSMLLKRCCPPADNQAEEILNEIYRRIDAGERYNPIENLALLHMYMTARLNWLMWRSRNPRGAGLALAREIEALTFKLLGVIIR